MSIDPIVQGLEISASLLSGIDALVKDQINNFLIDAIPGIDPVLRTIDQKLALSETTINAAETKIKTDIEPMLKALVPDAIQIVTGLISTLGENVGRLISNLATTEDVLQTAIGTLKQQAPALAGFLATSLAGGLGTGILQTLETLELENPESIDPILDELLAIKSLPPYLTNLLSHARNRHAPLFAFLLPALMLAALLPALGALVEPITQDIRQEAFANLPTKELDPPSVIEALIRGNITADNFVWRMKHNGFNTDVSDLMLQNRFQRIPPESLIRALFRNEVQQDYFETEMQQQGIDTERARLLKVASVPLLPEDVIRNAFLRGIIGTDIHDRMLAGYGYTPERASLMRQIYFYIPPVPDIIHMGIRNVFNPEIVERFNLIGDYPQAFEDAAAQQGVSKEWARKYWEAHWIVPSRTEAFEMFQRTVDKPLEEHADAIELEDGSKVYNVIGRDTLNLLLREVDTPPFYRDKVTEVAYRPFTRIDIRRLHKVGLLTKAQVERAYLDLGNSPRHARALAEFVVRLNSTATKDKAQQFTQGLQRKVIELYVQDKLTLDEVHENLTAMQFTEPEIEVLVAEAKLIREAERSTLIETGVGRLYTTGRITDKDAIERLRKAEVPDDAITTLFDKWNLQLEFRETPPHIERHRELTKAEILTALTDGIIEASTAGKMLEDMGYDRQGADTEISLALYKSDLATRRTIIDAIRASFVNGTIEQLEATNRLDALHIRAELRDAYLSEWSLARETRTERIPLTTLRDLFKGQYLNEPEVLSHLKRHRFTDDDATLMMRYWADQPPPRRLVSVSGTGGTPPT